MTDHSSRAEGRALILTRTIPASADTLYRCWTEPALIRQWFAPKPYETPVADLDVRPGGSAMIVMRGPDGVDLPNPGVYLEVVPGRRIVTTDAYVRAWEPSEKPMMTLIIEFEEVEPGRTRYTARALHWSEEDRKAHEEMGFHQGWRICTDQLEALATSL